MQKRLNPVPALVLGVLFAASPPDQAQGSIRQSVRHTAGAQSGLSTHGPPSPFGFPSYYEDYTGLRLGHCIDASDPLCGIPALEALPDPLIVGTNPAQSNFYEESFYWLAIANIDIPSRGEALLVLAIEGVFGNADELIMDGDQTVFSRLRIRLRGDGFETGFYRVSTPYGTFDFMAEAVGPGQRIVNHTVDCLHVVQPGPGPPFLCGSEPVGPNANYFSTPLGLLDDGTPAPEAAPNGPNFLTWDPAFAPAAPAGYAGDPAIPHQVLGAVAPNQNQFRVRFSRNGNFSSPAFDASTDLFSVMGKIVEGDDPPPPPPAGLTLTVNPATAGVSNTMTVTGATAEGMVAFAASSGLGLLTRPLPGCPAGITLGITPPRLLGIVSAPGGTSSLNVTIPPFLAGVPFHFQAVDFASCTTTNVVSATL